METYYWEGGDEHGYEYGEFEAQNDAEAQAKMPKEAMLLYVETEEGSMRIVWDQTSSENSTGNPRTETKGEG